MLTLITGPFGSGKTTQLLRLYRLAQSRGVTVAGVICPAVFEKQRKIGIDALLLPSEELLRLAERSSPNAAVRAGEQQTMWKFDTEVFTAVNQHLDSCVALLPELLIIDELGPQELLYGRGYTSALALLDRGLYADALVVVRPSLLDTALQRWGQSRVVDITSDDELLDGTVLPIG
ncbi:MAG: nucleoside-triphosphatase [Coriobacteriales bacterium]|jgi:nucleoside-triphosphatase THEP1|nr:nucleoside-triphosphatase [Coriobacteriales bacterium]